jgi:chromosome segregation ATPase
MYANGAVNCRKQIESLMAKLNESKKSERSLKTSLDEAEKKCTEWQGKAEAAEQHVKSAQALQNTINHLENRLEVANTERLDAEEQLFNLQAQQTPFDIHLPSLRVPTKVELGNQKVNTSFLYSYANNAANAY